MTSMISDFSTIKNRYPDPPSFATIYEPANLYQQPSCSIRLGSESACFSSDSECSMAQDTDSFDFDNFLSTSSDVSELNQGEAYFSNLMSQQATNQPTASYMSTSVQSQTGYNNQVVFTNLNRTSQAINLENQCAFWTSDSGLEAVQECDLDDSLGISDIEVSDDDDDDRLQNGGFRCSENLRSLDLPEIETLFPEQQVCKDLNLQRMRINYSSPPPPPPPPSSSYSTEAMRSRQRSGRQPILSQFLLHALETPNHYGNMIRWVDRQKGIFEFSSKNKENLARAWGLLKNNRRSMTYPKMARALRKYIENGIVLEKMKNRLRYRFLSEFLSRVRNGQEATQLSAIVKTQMYHFSRTNMSR